MNKAGAVAGFAFAGFVLGFVFGAEVRKAVPERIATSFGGGKFTAVVDVYGSIADGAKNLFK